jgi:hypothetical protein
VIGFEAKVPVLGYKKETPTGFTSQLPKMGFRLPVIGFDPHTVQDVEDPPMWWVEARPARTQMRILNILDCVGIEAYHWKSETHLWQLAGEACWSFLLVS